MYKHVPNHQPEYVGYNMNYVMFKHVKWFMIC